MVGASARRLDVAHEDEANSGGTDAAARRTHYREHPRRWRSRLSCACLQRTQYVSRGCHDSYLHFWLHAVKKIQHHEHARRRNSWRNPPMIGWAAARGELGAEAWSLFAILFVWQIPHFFAIAWMYRDDYDRAGFRMLSSGDDSGARSASQSVLFCMLLLIVTGVPAYLGLTRAIYLPISLALGGWFIAVAMRFHRKRTPRAARTLFLTSIAYLALLLLTLVLTKS